MYCIEIQAFIHVSSVVDIELKRNFLFSSMVIALVDVGVLSIGSYRT